MWSSVTIPGRPSILVIDASRNLAGWEHDFMDQFFSSLKRSQLQLIGEAPVRLDQIQELEPFLSQQFNCMILFSYGEQLKTDWRWLQAHPNLSPKVFAACMCEFYDDEITSVILQSPQTFAPIAVVPQSSATPRETGLFLLKFFTELNLHSQDNISGKMAWFSFSKATALLKKRRYTAKFALR